MRRLLVLADVLQNLSDVYAVRDQRNHGNMAEDLEAANVTLNAATMATLDALINQDTVVGSRYNAQANREVDTEGY